MLSQLLFALIATPLLVSAHFQMVFPAPRSSEDETEATGPCGGFPVSQQRTEVSLDSFPVALAMGHDRTVIQMLLALGNDPGNNFNITLEQTFQQQGEGNFCLPSVDIPQGLNISDGTNGTLQVVTDGEGGGGLYVCADLTFTSTTSALPSSCKNGTGITANPLPNTINANESTADGQPQQGSDSASSSESASSSPTQTASGSAGTESGHAAMLTVGWGVFGSAVLAAVAFM